MVGHCDECEYYLADEDKEHTRGRLRHENTLLRELLYEGIEIASFRIDPMTLIDWRDRVSEYLENDAQS